MNMKVQAKVNVNVNVNKSSVTNKLSELAAVSAQEKAAIPLAQSEAYKKKKICLAAVVAMQIAIMCGTAVPAAMTLCGGQVVTLKTKPIDPYDMFLAE